MLTVTHNRNNLYVTDNTENRMVIYRIMLSIVKDGNAYYNITVLTKSQLTAPI
jgi:hypothetical protein